MSISNASRHENVTHSTANRSCNPPLSSGAILLPWIPDSVYHKIAEGPEYREFVPFGAVVRSILACAKTYFYQPVASHSLLLGHLPIFGEFRRQHPPDVNIYVFHNWFADNFRKFFPDEKTLPPVVYLDLWPMDGIFTFVFDAVAGAQFTQIESLPKISFLTRYLTPLTGNKDILSTEGNAWKEWRTTLNPCFSPRNISALLPDLMEEVLVFADGLKQLAGPLGTWGPVVQLEKMTTNLSFDVIARATM